ncbi:phosphatase PAP2 family protein [Glaciimonas immobilis]|uniref:Membrane-associated phospholipid phosphatase n=1 Tax=Glaciimonas immobilis TaxID=728004 RepID=A0A840RTA0_9BURK|nr:phosphatase PAP2 family protein [Glaciimonas immobilis]KAF3999900.1 phosphatase PAP2 family protein [Glaciimonas immobilis]MBB5200392.1 membrane-associated phospholipid phosphatase [Glaciimonas immobilis]
MNYWNDFTHYGGSTVMLSGAIVVTLWLIAGRAWKMALWWCVLFGSGLTLVLVTKLAFVGWGVGIRALDFTGISGHAMRAMAVMPVMLYLVLQKAPRRWRMAGVLVGIGFGIMIGISRLVVHAHSNSEMISGCILGAIVSIGFIAIAERCAPPTVNRWLIAISLMAVFSTSYAKSAPTQRWLTSMALYVAGHERPYIRSTWKMAPPRAASSSDPAVDELLLEEN